MTELQTGGPKLYSVELDREPSHPEWDRFVDSAPGGHHVQTSRWAQVKAVLGWDAARVVVRNNGEIVSGGQVLLRRLSRLVTIAYAPRAPLVAEAHPASLAPLLRGVDELARVERIVHLKLQPGIDDPGVASALRARGFQPSDLAPGPTATTRVDLADAPERILARMRSGARSNIGKARRKGVTVRAGNEADLASFVELVKATSQRQGFPAYPADYYEAMWHQFSGDGHARLLVAERGDRVLSAVFLIGWGDSVIYKMGGWSGERTSVHPNELTHWEAMRWAQAGGYRYYDLDGIDPTAAVGLLEGESLDTTGLGVTHFKLGFGGEVVLFPGAYDFTFRPILGTAIRHVLPRLNRWTWLVQRLLGRER